MAKATRYCSEWSKGCSKWQLTGDQQMCMGLIEALHKAGVGNGETVLTAVSKIRP